MIDNYEFEIYYGEIEEPLYLTNDKNYICDDTERFHWNFLTLYEAD